jgi:hypothetical protein
MNSFFASRAYLLMPMCCVRFKSGQLFTAHGQLSIEDLSDFVISFPVELGQFSDDPAKTPSDMNSYTLETQQQITKSLRETIKLEDKPLPTDYSIERLYTKLSCKYFPIDTFSQNTILLPSST